MQRNHPVAETYNNKSILENHHIGLALAIMDLPGMDVLSSVPQNRREELRDMMRKFGLMQSRSPLCTDE